MTYFRSNVSPAEVVDGIEALYRLDNMEEHSADEQYLITSVLAEVLGSYAPASLALRLLFLATQSMAHHIGGDRSGEVISQTLEAMREFANDLDYHKGDCTCDTCFELMAQHKQSSNEDPLDKFLTDVLNDSKEN